MRKWNKLLALVLAMVMALSLTATAFASEGDTKADTDAAQTEDKKDDAAEPAEGEDDKDDAAEPAEGEDGKDDATEPAEGEDEKDGDAEPAEGEDEKDGDAEPAEGEDKKDEAAEIDYTGVSEWFKEDIAFVVGEKKLIANRETGLEPQAVMTRAEFVSALYNLAGTPAVEEENKFSDVADDAAYKNAVVWASANDIVKGNSDGENPAFEPDGELTRQQIAVFMFRYAVCAGIDTAVDGDKLADFPDVDSVESWAVAELNWAVANNLVNGSDGKLEPDGPALREQVAAILSRYIKEILPPEDATEPAEGEGEGEDAAEPAEGEDAAEPAENDKPDDASEPAEGEDADGAKEPAEGDEADGDAEPAEGDEADDAKEPAGDGEADGADTKKE